MNINPVNLKALTRNIPLANIYRYADLAKLYNDNAITNTASNNIGYGFSNPGINLELVLKSLRHIIKTALIKQETSDTREGLMAIYDE